MTREDAIKHLENMKWLKGYSNTTVDDIPLGSIIDDIIALLKAQEVVVRCKDCIYWKSNLLTHFWKPCDVVSTDKDWYCPCGKRR